MCFRKYEYWLPRGIHNNNASIKALCSKIINSFQHIMACSHHSHAFRAAIDPSYHLDYDKMIDKHGACIPVHLEHLMLAFAAFMNAQHAACAEQ